MSLTSIEQKIPSSLGSKSSSNSISITPAIDNLFEFTATVVRTATPYSANTVYGGALQLTSNNTPQINQCLLITDIDVIFYITSVPSGMTGFKLFPYRIAPPSNISDGGAFSIPSGDRTIIFYPAGISLGLATLADGGGSVIVQTNNINVPIRLNGTTINCYLETLGAFTPTTGSETFVIRVRAIAL